MAQISITKDPQYQLLAAKELCSVLNQLNIEHALIGRFVEYLLGFAGAAEDIDIMINVPAEMISQVVRPAMIESSNHVALLKLDMYFSCTSPQR
jgi:hypothetical protein